MHGTTSGAVKPHSFTLRPSSNGARCIGRTRPTLLLLRADHSGRYFGALSRCLAPPGSSLRKGGHLLHPIHVFSYWGYPSKLSFICQAFFVMLQDDCMS